MKTPTPLVTDDANEDAMILRKHGTMLAEWEAVKKESQVLREELKEDKWLTVFRTVTEQADGMMTSLEKAVNRCQVCVGMIQNIRFTDILRCRISSIEYTNSAQTIYCHRLLHPVRLDRRNLLSHMKFSVL